MRDPVFERQMFRKTEGTEPDGITSLVKSSSEYEDRKRRAEELIAVAKERQNPENFKTLSEQSRPGVFRPVATGQPQAPQPNTQQQLAQMQAMGFRPAGMADGGYVQHFADGSGPEGVRQSYTLPEIISNWWYNARRTPSEDEGERVTVPGPRGPSTFIRPPVTPPSSAPVTPPFASGRADDGERGIVSLPTQKPDQTKKEPANTGKPDADLPPTKLEDIKASRKENIAMAMIQAGLAMAGGSSPNALANIAAGGISGLGAFREAEKERRATEFEQRKYDEDRLARIQRSEELRQEKDLTREARVYDTAQQNITNIDREIGRLQTEMSKAIGDDAQTKAIQTRIDQLVEDRNAAGSIVTRSLRNLGYQGEDIFSAKQKPVTPAIDYSKLK